MNLFEQNIEFIQEQCPDLFKLLQSNTFDFSDFEVTSLEQGFHNVISYVQGEKYSLYNEATFFEDLQSIMRNSVGYRNVIVTGLGIGYHFSYLLNEKEIKKVFIIEPDIRMLMIYMHFQDIKDLFQNPKVELLIGDTEKEWFSYLAQNFTSIFTDKIRIIDIPFYINQYKDRFESFIKEVLRYSRILIANQYTLSFFYEQFIENMMKNIYETLPQSSSIEVLYDAHKDIPAIIVGSGPSLNKQIELLKDLENKAIIFGVGSAINVLEKNGVNPTYRVALDGSTIEASYFEKLNNKDVDLIYFPSLHHDSFNRYTGNKYYARSKSMSNHTIFVEEKLGITCTQVLGGATVSINSMHLAKLMGCNPIILVGQDFAYTNMKKYAEGAVIDKTIDKEGKRTLIKKDIYGDDICTDEGLYRLKENFDYYVELVASKWNNDIYNCTEGGLGIQGVPNKSFKEAITQYCADQVEINQKIAILDNQLQVKELFKHITQQGEVLSDIFDKIMKRISNVKNVILLERDDAELNRFNEEIREYEKELNQIDMYYAWIVPMCEAKLFLVDDIYEKEGYLVEDIHEQQKMLLKLIEAQYEAVQSMNQFILKTIDGILSSSEEAEGNEED